MRCQYLQKSTDAAPGAKRKEFLAKIWISVRATSDLVFVSSSFETGGLEYGGITHPEASWRYARRGARIFNKTIPFFTRRHPMPFSGRRSGCAWLFPRRTTRSRQRPYRIFGPRSGRPEHIPISDKMIGLVPHGNPVVARTKNAIDRAADKGQFLARFGDQSFFDQVIDRFIGYP